MAGALEMSANCQQRVHHCPTKRPDSSKQTELGAAGPKPALSNVVATIPLFHQGPSIVEVSMEVEGDDRQRRYSSIPWLVELH